MNSIQRKDHGFTLIELLVVIAVISVLAALLMPALRNARISAGKVACLSNMKRLYTGCALYANNYRGNLPVGNKQGANGFTRDYGQLETWAQEQIILPLHNSAGRKVQKCSIPSEIPHPHPSGTVKCLQWARDDSYVGDLGAFMCPNTYGWDGYASDTVAYSALTRSFMITYDFWSHPKRLAKFGGSPINFNRADGRWWLVTERLRGDPTVVFHFPLSFHVMHMDGHIDTHNLNSYYSLPEPKADIHTDNNSR